MRYLDVRIRMPITKLGWFLESLPAWASMIGYDKLAEVDAPTRSYKKRQSNGSYKPAKGSAPEAVLRVLVRPMKRFEIINRLEGRQKEKAVSSAIKVLSDRGLIVKDKEGSYGKA